MQVMSWQWGWRDKVSKNPWELRLSGQSQELSRASGSREVIKAEAPLSLVCCLWLGLIPHIGVAWGMYVFFLCFLCFSKTEKEHIQGGNSYITVFNQDSLILYYLFEYASMALSKLCWRNMCSLLPFSKQGFGFFQTTFLYLLHAPWSYYNVSRVLWLSLNKCPSFICGFFVGHYYSAQHSSPSDNW